MTETIQYTCKFCGSKHSFDCDMPEVIEARFNVEKMRPILTCNHCADHETDRRALERKILSVTKWIHNWRIEINSKLDRAYTQDRTHELRQQLSAIEVRAEEMLTVLTKKFAHCVCVFKRVTPIWESDFVDLIMKSPHNAAKHLHFYRSNVVR